MGNKRGTYGSWNKNGGCGAVQHTRKNLPKLLWKNEHFGSETLSLTFLQKQHDQASRKMFLKVSQVTKSFEKNKNGKFHVWKLSVSNIRKNFLSQESWFFLIFSRTKSKLITFLVISFSFFAGCGNFRIMVEKIRGGGGKSLILGA